MRKFTIERDFQSLAISLRSIVLPLLFIAAAQLACARADVPIITPVRSPATPTPFQPLSPTPVEALAEINPQPTATPLPAHISREEIEEGTVMLEIPRIGISVNLEVGEWEEPPFARNTPKWISELGGIGLPGVSLIYGERQWGPIPKIFSNLDDLQSGDLIIVRSSQEELTFVVSETVVVDPGKVWTTVDEFREKGGGQIVLVTCTPWGTSRYRLLVFADLDPQSQP